MIREMLTEAGSGLITRRDLLRKCAARGIDDNVAERGVETWINSGVLFEDSQKRIRYTLVN